MPAADSFGKHLSDRLNDDSRPADKPVAPDRPSQAQDQAQAREKPATAPRPDAPKATRAAEAGNKPEKTDIAEEPDADKSAAQDPAATARPSTSKTAKVAAKAQESDSPAEVAGAAPADFILKLAADPAAAMARPAGLAGGKAPGPKATGQQPAQNSEVPPSVAAIINGLPLGALGLTAVAPLQNIQEAAPGPQEKAAATKTAAIETMPQAAAELLAEAARLSKDIAAAGAPLAGPQSADKTDKTDIAAAEPMPGAFAELVASAGGKAGKLATAKPESQAQATAIKPGTAPALAAPPALAPPRTEGAAAKAEAGAKPDVALTALTPEAEKGETIAKGQPAPDAPRAVTLSAAQAPDPDNVPAAPGKAEATANPLPFATLGTPGQTPLQVAALPQESGHGPAAVGQAYVAAHVSLEITKTVSEGGNQFSIRLDPAELGRVDVKLHFGGDGRVTAAVTADHQNTLDLLRRDASLLDRALQDSGLKTDQGSLSFSLRQQGQQWQGQQAFLQSNEGTGNQAVATAEDVIAPAIANARSYVSNRALDITV